MLSFLQDEAGEAGLVEVLGVVGGHLLRVAVKVLVVVTEVRG